MDHKGLFESARKPFAQVSALKPRPAEPSDKSYQIDSSIALNKASGGQAGSPFAEQEITPRA